MIGHKQNNQARGGAILPIAVVSAAIVLARVILSVMFRLVSDLACALLFLDSQ